MTDDERVLAFYRRCRVEHQRRWYDGRAHEFGTAASQLAIASAAVLVLTSLASFGAGFDWSGTTTLEIVAIALPALSTGLAAFGALYAHEQQRKLYLDALSALRTADKEQPAEPAKYAEVVEEILAREQAQWGQLVSEIKPTQTGG